MVQSQGERVAAAIRARIESGALKPGDILPTVRALCAEYEAGVGPVRAALMTLRVLGLLEYRAGVGNVVVGKAGTNG